MTLRSSSKVYVLPFPSFPPSLSFSPFLPPSLLPSLLPSPPSLPPSLSSSLPPSLPSLPPSPRLVEKARHRQQAITRASSSVTDRMFIQQAELKKHFIDHIAGATTCERDMLHQWRAVIQLNTHPRYVPLILRDT